nr:hypothetical protein [Candidatus Moranbacteria bacterium]
MKNKRGLLYGFFLILFAASFLVTPTTHAILIDDISKGAAEDAASDAMNKIIDELGIDESELKYFIKSMNVTRRKKQQPQVSVSFNPGNPVPGQKVTAVATPTYFMNRNLRL